MATVMNISAYTYMSQKH